MGLMHCQLNWALRRLLRKTWRNMVAQPFFMEPGSLGWSLDGCPFALKNGFKAPRESKPTKAPKAKTFTPDTLQLAWACLQNRRSPPSDQLPHAVVHVRPPKGASHGRAYMRDTPSLPPTNKDGSAQIAFGRTLPFWRGLHALPCFHASR